MQGIGWFGVARTAVAGAVVLLFAAVSSGAVSLGVSEVVGYTDVASAAGDSAGRVRQLPPDNDLPEPDNASLCSPRKGPRVQTAVDPSGLLRVTISAGTGFDGFPITLRRLRIGPTQNAAVSIGPHVGRTDPFYYELVGVPTVSFTASRVNPGQSVLIPLIVFDDCEEWKTFAGAGMAVGLPAVVPTATPRPCLPGQSCGSIPGELSVNPSQFGPGTRVNATLFTRPGATCELTIAYPGRQPQSLGVKSTDSGGRCSYDLFVSYDVPFGDGTFTGTARDAFGVRVDTARFTVEDRSGDNDEDDDNIAPFGARVLDGLEVPDTDGNDNGDNGDDNENDNDE